LTEPTRGAAGTHSRFLLRRFPALQHRDYRLLWFGQIVSLSGSQMQNVAIGWEIYERTGRPEMLGLIGLARIVPIVIFSLLGGLVADSYPRRTIMMITQTVAMLAALTLGIISALDMGSAVAILALTAVTAATAAFDNPARQSLVPNLVAPEHLTNAVSLNTMMFHTSMIAGPALAGLLIDAADVSAVYWINAGSFLAVIGALAAMHVRETERPGRSQITRGAFLDGLRFVRSNKTIWSTMLLDFFATFFASATALIPVFAKEVLNVGAKGMGLLYSAEAIGSLAAGIVMSMLPDPRRKGAVLLVSVVIYGVATALYGASTHYVLSLGLLALVGAGDSVSTVLRSTIRQKATPDHIRGRMTSVNMLFFMGGPQLGNLEAGLVAGLIGAPLAVVTGGVATIGVVVVMAWVYPQLRRFEG
jgi:MFS family permease